MADIAVGQKIGAWTVIGEGKDSSKVMCRCDCGNERSLRKWDLSHSKSLMCRSCSVSVSKTIHGDAPYGKTSPEYNTWMHMNQRCHNPRNKDYKNYGGRGIQVCELWRDSFEAFLLMVGRKPGPEYTIDRIDVNKGYEPGNVKWSTRAEQNANTRSNINLTIDGETKTVAEWARDSRCPVDQFVIYKRLERGGKWLDPKLAVFEPKQGTQDNDE